MKAFISPIYFQTNAISLEKLTGGLLLFSEKKNWMAFSEDKINIAGKLGGVELKKLVEHTESLLKNNVAKSNELLKKGDQELFKLKESVSQKYLDYLSKYSKGVIQFGKPKPIAIEASDAAFEKLFELYVGEKPSITGSKKKPVTFHSVIKKKLNVPGLDKKADIDYVIHPEQVSGILKPAQITLLTKNGAIEAVQAIDFCNAVKTIADHVYEFQAIAGHLNSINTGKKSGKNIYKVVANKPLAGSDQEKLFNAFYKTYKDAFDVIEPEEINEVIKNILAKPHQKFSEFLLTL